MFIDHNIWYYKWDGIHRNGYTRLAVQSNPQVDELEAPPFTLNVYDHRLGTNLSPWSIPSNGLAMISLGQRPWNDITVQRALQMGQNRGLVVLISQCSTNGNNVCNTNQLNRSFSFVHKLRVLRHALEVIQRVLLIDDTILIRR